MIISKKTREEYNIDSSFINYADTIAIFEDYYSAKVLAEHINKIREVKESYNPDRYVRASVLNGLGLLDELYTGVIKEFFKENGDELREDLKARLTKDLGKKQYYSTLKKFADQYPSNELFSNKKTFDEFIKGKTNEIDNEYLLLDEMILASLGYKNTAIDQKAYGDLFDYNDFFLEETLTDFYDSMNDFFEEGPSFPSDTETNLISFLEGPLKEQVKLEEQLNYIKTYWGKYLNSNQLKKLLNAIAYILEENDLIWRMFHPGGSFSPILTYDLGEYEAFSEDKDWMPNVVMIAKSTYVWLDQLSKKYQRHIHRLDQIPDEELILYRNRGITAIWLIGLWERSTSSKKLKHIMGNPDAEASAYSLKDYSISFDLGGFQSYENLRDRARNYGIRLASDMVPNHMGIDSNIIFDRPDYFISLDHSPFPSYTFNGHNLSENSDIGIFVEDHYYNHSDAAVVFKYVNFKNGETRYIYHGNDGTSIPWNDTAQLDFLKEEVRKYVIENILRVARMFPIIRFDAAMTLAKNQFQRLWYPEPGTPAAVASRSSYTISSEDFNRLFPNEFWREVVDTVAQKVPDTLLLAEAFWMLEGYFVRTLGMHRVYNSAFMNMLKSELNDQYRTTIKNTLDFDPEILKRFVNFMNNPDEQTAVAQFGKGDKYFGVLLMMSTMPGLPMIGHGQIEGYEEKYGMEFKRAYWNEQDDQYLIKRHEEEIFPLLHKRWLFSEVVNFRLFDFYRSDGSVDENVFAFSNGRADKRGLIIYHNKYASTAGWINTSARYLDRWTEQREFKQQKLGEALLLTNKADKFVIFKDYKTNLEFIRRSTEIYERGMYLILGAYQYHIFMDFYEVEDTLDKNYSKVSEYLNGAGTISINDAIFDLELEGIHSNIDRLLHKDVFISLEDKKSRNSYLNNIKSLFDEISKKEDKKIDMEEIEKEVSHLLNLIMDQAKFEQTLESIKARENFYYPEFEIIFEDAMERKVILYAVITLLFIGKEQDNNNFTEKSLDLINKWRLKKYLYNYFKEFNFSTEKADTSISLVQILVRYYTLPEETYPSNFIRYIIYDLFNDQLVTDYLGINFWKEEYWYSKERFQHFMAYLMFNIILYNASDMTIKLLPKLFKIVEQSDKAEYKVKSLRNLLKSERGTILKP